SGGGVVALARKDCMSIPFRARCVILILVCEVLRALGRVVVVGDIHGDVQALKDCLLIGKIIDSEWNWVAHEDTLVQTGDLVDRGEFSEVAVQRMAALRKDAQRKGGKVVLLLGNHELLALQGHTEYTHRAELDRFGGRHGRNEAFSTSGAIGSLLLAHWQACYAYESTYFVHAGLITADAVMTVSEMNKRTAALIQNQSWNDPLFANDGPFWNREMIKDAAEGRCYIISGLTESLSGAEGRSIQRIVVGHTIQKAGLARQYCDGKLVAIDVGMSNATELGDKRRVVAVIEDGSAHLSFLYAGKPATPRFQLRENNLDPSMKRNNTFVDQSLLALAFLATVVTPCIAAAMVALLVKLLRRMRVTANSYGINIPCGRADIRRQTAV
ncbi:hypothetical protein DIPPA_34132, partial [Diplonema papillatum]